jgi:hypothetical protein
MADPEPPLDRITRTGEAGGPSWLQRRQHDRHGRVAVIEQIGKQVTEPAR